MLAQLALAEPVTRPMFGSTAVYLEERVVFILREKGDADDGVWIAYEPEREPEVLALFPNAIRISRIPNARGWRKLAASHEAFEEDVLHACRVARASDSPLGKVPVRRLKERRTRAESVPAPKRTGGVTKATAERPKKAAPERARKTKKPG